MEFFLSSSPLEPSFLTEQLSSTDSGALVCFNGTVRAQNAGRAVTALEYEAYSELCAGEMERIFAEARDRFAIIQARVVHRTGRLELGELAVWIGVTAAHRGAAFRACRFIIDELKSRLPIWKKEFYADGDSGWISAQTPSAAQVLPDIYYSRQISVPGIGAHGQQRLQNARVLVVGAGGLGCAALRGLTGSGIGTIGICENDDLEESNLARQTLYRHEDIGRPKIDLAVIRLQEINPSLCYIKHPQRICAANAKDILKGYDLILDCSDNFPTKFLL
ncbi:MAG: ThiF family adenylyltransferase, partial [Candidatus Omnitrophica bacterium]|nr:ThiF family adenylyltransferase [Candidatus Omnitrophota bacterium]